MLCSVGAVLSSLFMLFILDIWLSHRGARWEIRLPAGGGWHARVAKYYDNIYTYIKFPISLLTHNRTEKRTRTENGVVKINFSRMRLSLAKPCYSDDELLRFHWYWGGGTKPPFVNFSVSKIFDHAKVPVKFVESHSYLTGITAAELRRHLAIINVIFNN